MAKYKWSIMLVILVVVLSVITNKANVEIIKVGLLVDLTSTTSQMGIQGRDAAIIAVERYNERQNDVEIELVIKNTEGKSHKVLKLMEKLKKEKVKIVIGPFTSGETVGMNTLLASGDFLVFSPTASTDDLAKLDDYFIRTIGLGSDQGNLLAEMTVKYGNDKKVAIIYDSTNEVFVLPAIQSYRRALKESDVQISFIESFEASKEQSFLGIVDRAINNEVEGIVYFGTGIKAADFLQTLRVKGYNGHKYLSMWSSTPELIPNSGAAAEGVYVVDVLEPNNQHNNSKKTYREKFYNKYGFEPSYVAYMTDETMNILFLAIDTTKNDDPYEVKKTILSFGTFQGYGSKYSINLDGDSSRPYIPLIIKNGRLQQVD